jgi:tetratricopeptide (TPR) repeat protein
VRHGARIVVVIAVALFAIGESPPATLAQDASLPTARTPLETEALELLTNGLMVSARAKADEILERDNNSIVGHYVMGRVMFEAEGSLPRAMFHLGRARELTGESVSGSPFHRELLYTIARLAGQMELYEYQLDVLGYHDHIYDPDLIAERCWPLIKLDRQDEAREFARVAVGSPNPWQRSAGLNALCALEGEARTREPYHTACLAALEDARAEARRPRDPNEEQPGIAVDAYNATLAGAMALRFDDAERYALEGVQRFEPTGANPWELLVELYLSEGRTDEALNAFGQMTRWNDRQPPAIRDQGRAQAEALVAILFLIAGETERALERIDRAIARPDRRGLTTDGADQALGRHALLRRIIRRTLDEEEAEEASWRGIGSRIGSALTPRMHRTWADSERVTAVMADSEHLIDSIRPFMQGGIPGLSPWLTGELIDVLGPAVVNVALSEARSRDTSAPGAAGYYDALSAEILLARGDTEEALEEANAALVTLEASRGAALVRGRLAALGAMAAEEEGQHPRANELYGMALGVDPGVFRRLRVAIPVSFSASGEDAEEASGLLENSPRFRDEDGYMQLVSTQTADGLSTCLRTTNGNDIRCVISPTLTREQVADLSEEDQELSVAQRHARDVHRNLFSAQIQFSRIDTTSLDGRPIGGSQNARDRLRDLMGNPAP